MTKPATIALGTFPFAGPFSRTSDDQNRELIERFASLDGRHLDTAPTYAHGAVEELVGRVLASGSRQRWVIATSCGYVRKPDGSYDVSGRHEDIIADCDESLARLQTDVIDVYYSHIPDPATPFAETIGAMRELKSQGKIRAIGVSNVTLEQLHQYNAEGDVQFVQNRHSLVNRAISEDFSAYCRAAGITISIYQALERGLLTDRGANVQTYRDGDLRASKPEFRLPVRERLAMFVQKHLKPIADSRGQSIETLAVWWALQQPQVGTVQCGATRPEQIDRFMSALSMPTDAELLAALEHAYAALTTHILDEHQMSVRGFMGLEAYNIYKGSASGETR